MQIQPSPPAGGPPNASPKPEITTRQANWQAHIAGMKAEQQARAKGFDPDAAAALLDADGITIAGHSFPPVHAGFLLLLPQLDAIKQQQPALGGKTCELMAIAFALGAPRAAWESIRADATGGAFLDACFAFSEQFSLNDLTQIGQWIARQMEQIRADTAGEDDDEPKKKAAQPATTVAAEPAAASHPTS